MNKFFFVFLLSFFITNSFSKIVYVKESATGTNDGTSWVNAFTKLQNGIGATVPGDEIWIAAGTYKPTYVAVPIINDRLVSFQVPNGVKMYGGFAGTETLLSQRDWATNQSIVSGNIGSLSSAGDNSCHVLLALNVSTGTVLDGLRIISGRANGGGIYDYGGGLVVTNSNLTVQNCIFTDNYSKYGGAAISHSNGNSTTSGVLNIINCKFLGNTGGPLLSLNGTQSNVYRSDLSDNQCGDILSMTNGFCNIDRCIISGNTTYYEPVYIGNTATIQMSNTLIAGNISEGISGIYIANDNNSSNVIANTSIVGNKSVSTDIYYSAALSGPNATTLQNCILWGNYPNPQISGLSGCSVVFSCIQGGYIDTGNISFNPQFVNPGLGINAPFNASNYNFQLQTTSPVINAGDNNAVLSLSNFDLLDSIRISAVTVDMGCYEKQFCSTNATITTSGPVNFCIGGAVTLSVQESGNYHWSNGLSSKSITVATSGTYTVNRIDSNGCFGYATKDVVVYPVAVSISGDTLFCEGGSVVLTASSPDGNVFNWSAGGSGSTLNVTQTGTYSVTITTINSCTATATKFVKKQVVNVPFISSTGYVLSSTPGLSYQWYLNGNVINGASQQTHIATQNGNYFVIVSENGCESERSNTITIINVGIEDGYNADLMLMVYPNPTGKTIYLKNYVIGASYFIFDELGKLMLKGEIDSMEHQVDLSTLQSGIYMLKLKSPKSENSNFVKLIKL